MNMMGFYPVSPSSGNYTIGSPMFAKVTIDVGGSTPFGFGFGLGLGSAPLAPRRQGAVLSRVTVRVLEQGPRGYLHRRLKLWRFEFQI